MHDINRDFCNLLETIFCSPYLTKKNLNCLSLLLHVAISIIFMCKSSVPLNAFYLKEDCRGINSLGMKVVRFWKGWGPNFISYM